MEKTSLEKTIFNLFNRDFNEELTDDQEEELEELFSETVSIYGWKETFNAIEHYMYLSCVDGFSANNFALWFSFYRCSEVGDIYNPYRFLGYLYYRMNLEPWKYDAVDIMDSLVKDILASEEDKSHDPYWNTDYKPENDPDIINEVEKLRKENI